MQPLDVAVYGPFKKYHGIRVECISRNAHKPYCKPIRYRKAIWGSVRQNVRSSVQNAVNGFTKSGIWTYDPNVFGDEDYASSTMTDRPFPKPSSSMTEGPVNDAQSTVGIDHFNGTSSTVTVCALNDSPATTVTAKKTVAESSTQSSRPRFQS
ncbi:hypothetical protein EVAR_68364_1 [Eumeta japonica]|uniref:Uncharacterized protein n=1 Tax=Eumeta variegata TaxID=151549 RepID=A0A4C1YXN8_EUMVA|nr:hypothetical protein EVAR_68364_1 [Eumeta japonica]